MTEQPIKSARFISLRLKLLLGFTVLFSGVFAAAFYWFYSFTTAKTMTRLFDDMHDTAMGTAERVDVEDLIGLYTDPALATDPEQVEVDPRYQEQLDWFNTIHGVEPRAWPYTFVLVDVDPATLEPGSILGEDDVSPEGRPEIATSKRVSALAPNQTLPSVFLTDLWVDFDPAKAASFLETSTASTYTLEVYRTKEAVDRPLYDDGQFGSWISTYVPLKDDAGNVVAVLGVDFEADYVRDVQKAIRNRIGIAFGIAYMSLFIMVYMMSDVLARPILGLTQVAKRIGEGNYEHNLDAFSQRRMPDEISKLAEVFALMVNKVRQREESLKQQVAELKIEIDETKRRKQVSEIVDTDFFHDLQAKAHLLRQRSRHRNNGTGEV
jgi:HAMP domain-containing protein